MNNIDQAFAEFFEFPEGSDGKCVSTVSAKLFARLFAENALGEIDKLWEVISTQRSLEAHNQGEINDLEVRAIAAEQERDRLKDQLFEIGCVDVDVIRCLKTLAYEHNHSDITKYQQLAKRTMDKCANRRAAAKEKLAAHDADVIEKMAHKVAGELGEQPQKVAFGMGLFYTKLIDNADRLRNEAKEPTK